MFLTLILTFSLHFVINLHHKNFLNLNYRLRKIHVQTLKTRGYASRNIENFILYKFKTLQLSSLLLYNYYFSQLFVYSYLKF